MFQVAGYDMDNQRKYPLVSISILLLISIEDWSDLRFEYNNSNILNGIYVPKDRIRYGSSKEISFSIQYNQLDRITIIKGNII